MNNNELNTIETIEETKEMTMTPTELINMIQKLTDELNELKGTNVTKTDTKKNQRPGKATAGRKYVLLSKELSNWGKVPQQQADIAKVLSAGMELKKEYTEAEVFDMLIEGAGDHVSLYSSKQDPTYLFRYYRGLKNDGKHAGFIARNFIQQIG